MNELQHLTTPSSLKFCLALCFSSGPNSSKFGPSWPQVGSNFFHLAKEMATTFLEPERTLGFIFLLINNFGIYRLQESTMTLQIGLYRTTNDMKLHIPVCYEIKILSTTEMKFYVK